MAPHADTLHLGEQQVGEIECAGASKDVYDDSVKVADIPVQVPQTTVVNEHDHDNKHYTKDCQEIFDEKSRADTPMMEIDPQIAMDLVFAPTCTDEEQSEIYMMTKPSNSLSDKLILEPYRYLSSLPGKGIRNITIDAFNVWLKAPESSTNIIKSAIGMLHSSSLMLDDLEDGSPLRRGKPSTHVVFGAATTINSATFLFIKVINELKALHCPAAVDLYTEEMHNLFVGQSYDGYWTNTLACPTVEEYIQMIDGKTGGLFRLSISLLAACSTRQITVDLKMSLAHLCCLIGRYFQIRDDYQNLASPDYASQKGFCEDLDEGKYSLPLIFTMRSTTNVVLLRSLLQQRKCNDGLSFEQKTLVLDIITAADGLQHTLRVLKGLYNEVEKELNRLEVVFGEENAQLRQLLRLLRM